MTVGAVKYLGIGEEWRQGKAKQWIGLKPQNDDRNVVEKPRASPSKETVIVTACVGVAIGIASGFILRPILNQRKTRNQPAIKAIIQYMEDNGLKNVKSPISVDGKVCI